uniref:MIF4G domain-containing protein n=1 Tax=Romanomermis culicivorax TaxID=13658 RepID=A0A915KV92_ROMCU
MVLAQTNSEWHKKTLGVCAKMSTSSEIQLHRVANPWKPIRQRKVDSDPEIYKTETDDVMLSQASGTYPYEEYMGTDITYSFEAKNEAKGIVKSVGRNFFGGELFWDVRALLNKITPQTFEDLSKDLYDLWARADTNNRADSVIDILFRKVCDEPTFAELYASLCSGLCAHQVTFPPPQDCGINTFNFLLLMKFYIKCVDVEKKILKDNLEEKVNKYKWRIFGSIRFVGELYKFGLLTQYLAHICVHRLINKAQQFDEEVTQCLCQLLTNIGGKLENEKADVKNRVSGAYVEKYFEVLKSLQKDSRFCKRIQFEILNLIELREVHHWKPRRHKGGPKKLEELRADIELEKMADNFEFKFCGKRRDYERIGGTSYGLISSS